MPKRKYQKLLEDPDIRRWHDSTQTGRRITREIYLRRVGYLAAVYGIDVRELLGLTKQAAKDKLVDLVDKMDKQGYAGSYIGSSVKAVKSFLSSKGFDVGKIRIEGVDLTPTLEEEVVPNKDELQEILNSKDIRVKATIALMAFTGVRPNVIARGSDGLRIADLPDARIDNDKVQFDKLPALVKVRDVLSKTGKAYITYLNKEGCDYLRQYLEGRLRDGEKLRRQSALITNKWDSKNAGGFISTTKLLELVRGAIRQAGYRFRPYILRRYFDHYMLLDAVAEGAVPRDYVVFWMGHEGDIEHDYTTHHALPTQTLEKMRESYSKASEKYLETVFIASEDHDRSLYRNLLIQAGVKDEQKIAEVLDGEREFMEARVAGALQGLGLKMAYGDRSQIAIPANELNEYLAQGYRWVGTRGNGDEIVELVGVDVEREIRAKSKKGSN
jgi:hypothetical protein